MFSWWIDCCFLFISDGMRCCRSDWPGFGLFCCYQPLVNRDNFGLFLFHKFSNFTVPPSPQAALKVEECQKLEELARRRRQENDEIKTQVWG